MKPRPTELDAATSAARRAGQPSAGVTADEWRTALTCIEPNKILVRGYPLDEVMGRLTFGEAIYLLLVGEVPTPGDGPPDGGAPGLVHRPRRHAALDAGRAQHGHDRRAVACVRGRRRARVRPVSRRRHRELHAVSRQRAGARTRGRRRCAKPPSTSCRSAWTPHEIPPGFGHRFHTRDPRAARLFQMALELEVEADHIQMIRAVELVLARPSRRTWPDAARQHRRRHRRRLRRPRHPADDRRRAVHHLARARHRRARRRGTPAPAADAPDRSQGSPLRRAVGRGACRSGESRPRADCREAPRRPTDHRYPVRS